MSGICDTCQRNQVCRKPIGGMDSCRLYISGKESNYSRLFGTPERAAQTLADLQTCSLGFDLECDECAVYSLCKSGARNDRDALLEWLRGDA